MARRTPVNPKALTVAAVEQAIQFQVDRWPGNCYAIAQKIVAAGLVQGRTVYGWYHGPVADASMFAGKPVLRHGWIAVSRTRVVDPTRWVFEAVDPYIYRGTILDDPTVDEYDEGGQRFALATLTPMPAPDATSPLYTLKLPAGVSRRLALPVVPGVGVVLTQRQLLWVANLPYPVLGADAWAVYHAIKRAGREALVPIDNWDRAVFEHG